MTFHPVDVLVWVVDVLVWAVVSVVVGMWLDRLE